jgi:hypothetical protein
LDGCEASAWPTPNALASNDGEEPETWRTRQVLLVEKGYNGNGAGVPLAIAALEASSRMTPKTPTGGPEARSSRAARGSGGEDLGAQVTAWPSPPATDHKGSTVEGQRRGQLSEATECRCFLPVPETSTPGGPSSPPVQNSRRPSKQKLRLNPPFVCWLMGWPEGWINYAPVEMASWLSRARRHLSYLLDGRG